MSISAVAFPDHLPSGYCWFDDEPVFDPSVHLALEEPAEVFYLRDFGYSDEEIATKASPVATSSPFRVMSDEGARVLLQVARKLRAHAISCERIDNMVRGGCYRSRFLRDLCLEPSITAMLCKVYGTDVAPHTMPVHLGHMNFAPDDPGKAVDKWHHDTLPLDYVMLVTDPRTLSGGQFEYFVGTKHEMAELARSGETPPPDRVVAPDFPGPGYAIALHGDMVVHRGAALNKPGERISMVNGYVSTDTSRDDQHRHEDLMLIDDPNCLYAEWAKHAAWRARHRLASLEAEMQFSSDREQIARALEDAVKDVNDAIREFRSVEKREMMHYEKTA